jgi:CheY-like chemotaxis protein
VVGLRNGREALDWLERASSDQRPALIFLDLMMPVLDGQGFLVERAARPSLRDIPVVVLTASGRKALPDTVATLQKPMGIEDFLGAITTWG